MQLRKNERGKPRSACQHKLGGGNEDAGMHILQRSCSNCLWRCRHSRPPSPVNFRKLRQCANQKTAGAHALREHFRGVRFFRFHFFIKKSSVTTGIFGLDELARPLARPPLISNVLQFQISDFQSEAHS